MQAQESYRLIVKRGPEPGKVFELTAEFIKLGREVQNDVVINDREVSRTHLTLARGPEGYTIEDLNSTNGTFVNGKRITGAVLLKNGDMVALGETITLGYEVVRAGMPTIPAAAQPASPYAPPSAQPPAAQPYMPPPSPAVQPYAPPQAPLPPAQNPYQAPQVPVPPAQNPYQAPQAPVPPAQNPYQAPAPLVGGGASPAPYGSPAPQPAPYGNPAGAGYSQDPYAPPADAGYFQASYGTPMPADYDPYTMREDDKGNNNMRLILIGCLGLMMLCCCASIVAVVMVDTLNLYCQIPLVNNLLEGLGLIRCVVVGG